jgi:hypothetical protein
LRSQLLTLWLQKSEADLARLIAPSADRRMVYVAGRWKRMGATFGHFDVLRFTFETTKSNRKPIHRCELERPGKARSFRGARFLLWARSDLFDCQRTTDTGGRAV